MEYSGWAPTWEDLQKGSERDLITEFNKPELIIPTKLLIANELTYRHLKEISNRILSATLTMKWLTVGIFIFTLINVFAFVFQVFGRK